MSGRGSVPAGDGGRGAVVVAVDGPGGVGKSTVSRRVAHEIGASHLDTGAFYRAAALLVLEAGADPADPSAVEQLVADVDIHQEDGATLVGERDVSGPIRSEAVTDVVSDVAAHPGLRRRMVELQRHWVRGHGGRAVVEGRDIGTVVFPDAPVKVYLDAEAEVRAARRSGESGGEVRSVGEALRRRDRFDSTRPVSPLKPSDDAHVIDTTHLDLDEVVAEVLRVVERAVLDP